MQNVFNLKTPIIGLSPMDAITDSPFRHMVKKYSNPDIVFTEFTNVMGMCIAGDNIFHTFHFDESQRPIIGQIYGKEQEYFYHAAKIICALGFDSVDINMGCPSKNVASSGAGAGLIRTPELALEIIAAVKDGVRDWTETHKFTGLSERSLKAITEMLEDKKLEILNYYSNQNLPEIVKTFNQNNQFGLNNFLSYWYPEYTSQIVPTSVKTRIGYDKPITEKWISTLDKANPEFITVHGRILKQMYTGEANWEEIAKAVQSTSRPVLANGDIKTLEDAEKVLEVTKANGFLVGRGTYGNPWIFNELKKIRGARSEDLPSIEEKIRVLIEHTERFLALNPEPKAFFQMRKHFGWYMKGFENAGDVRARLMVSNSIEEVREILEVRS